MTVKFLLCETTSKTSTSMGIQLLDLRLTLTGNNNTDILRVHRRNDLGYIITFGRGMRDPKCKLSQG